ncbi:hypothetical protein FPQ18DRAFT_410494 [Pyronema domesticum]|nr:hypothetical protein FPQ18DRAFT_410494 [Pyronema domesticum]
MSDQHSQLQKWRDPSTTTPSSQSPKESSTDMRTNMDLLTDEKAFHFHLCTHSLLFDVCFEIENYNINPNLEIAKAMHKYDRNKSRAKDALIGTDRIPIQIYLQKDGSEIVRPHQGWSRTVAKPPAGSWNFKECHITIEKLRQLCTNEQAPTSGSVVEIAEIKYHVKQAQGLQTLFLKRNVEDLQKLQENKRSDLFPKIYAALVDDEEYEIGLLRQYIPGTLLDDKSCPEYNEKQAEEIVNEVNIANKAMIKSGVH